jgi:hypothetical protein
VFIVFPMSRPRLRSDFNKESFDLDTKKTNMADATVNNGPGEIKDTGLEEKGKPITPGIQVPTETEPPTKKVMEQVTPSPEGTDKLSDPSSENEQSKSDEDLSTQDKLLATQLKMGKTLDSINETLITLTASFHSLEAANTVIKADVDKLRGDVHSDIQQNREICDTKIINLEAKLFEDHNIKHAEISMDLDAHKEKKIPQRKSQQSILN